MTAHPELIVPLAALPGLDATGLRLLSSVSGGEYVCIGYRPRVRAWYGIPAMCDARTGEECEWVPLGLDARIDLADSATRDRACRWIASRIGCTDCHNGMWWIEMMGDLGWVLVSPNAQMYRWTRRPMEGGPRDDRRWHLPALEPLDSLDNTRLPDGSRRVDAHALALVAVHLGQTVTP